MTVKSYSRNHRKFKCRFYPLQKSLKTICKLLIIIKLNIHTSRIGNKNNPCYIHQQSKEPNNGHCSGSGKKYINKSHCGFGGSKTDRNGDKSHSNVNYTHLHIDLTRRRLLQPEG